MEHNTAAHSLDLLLGELEDDDGLAELEQELGLNDDIAEGEYPMMVMHAGSSSTHPDSDAAPSSTTSTTSPSYLAAGFRPASSSIPLSSSPYASSSSSSYTFGRGENAAGSDEQRGELAIVQHYKSKFSNAAIQAQEAADNTVKAIFVIKFDVNEGNVIDWQYPKDIDLTSVEFKAIASGSHHVDADVAYGTPFIPQIDVELSINQGLGSYFKLGDLYGVACYQKRMMRGHVEIRGVMMSAVGLLTTNFPELHQHLPFLSDQVRAVNHSPTFNHQLLEDYYRNSHQVLADTNSSSLASSPSSARVPHGYFMNFLKHFGPHVFAIWKSVLLRQRILFYAPPPVKFTCGHVYCANALSYTKVRKLRWDPNPLFYVNINDMKTLHEQESFIACTTEAIFQKKFNIYDLYISKKNFHLPSKEAELPLAITDGDKARYRYLLDIISTHLDTYRAEELIIKYFLMLNNKLFEGLLQAHQNNDTVHASELPERFGLHVSDFVFFVTLVGTLNLNFPITPPKSCLCC